MMGGWYNAYTDGYDVIEEELVPATREEAMEAVYEEAMSNKPKEIRFAREQFCKELIEKLFDNDSDAEELNKAVWGTENKEDNEMESKREMLNNMTVKELRTEAKAHGIEGISRAKKDELIEALMNSRENTGNTIQISKVKMFAFTGMYIGEFEAEVRDGKIIVNTTSKGELMFNLKTGKEIADKNKQRYANRVEAV